MYSELYSELCSASLCLRFFLSSLQSFSGSFCLESSQIPLINEANSCLAIRPLFKVVFLMRPWAIINLGLVSFFLWAFTLNLPLHSALQSNHLFRGLSLQKASYSGSLGGSVKCLTLAQVMISWFNEFEPLIWLCADSSNPGACFRFCLLLSPPLPCLHSVSLS